VPAAVETLGNLQAACKTECKGRTAIQGQVDMGCVLEHPVHSAESICMYACSLRASGDLFRAESQPHL
jgi:hypothetical protein